MILTGVSFFILSHYFSNFESTQNIAKFRVCGVIFGAAVWRDNIPSHALNDRIQAGIKLFKENKINCLVLSGGSSTYGSHEVEVMKEIILKSKIPKEVLIFDYKGINTLATIKNLPKDIDEFVFISNDFHLARIKMLAWQENIPKYSLQKSSYIGGRYYQELYYFSREVGAILYYFVNNF